MLAVRRTTEHQQRIQLQVARDRRLIGHEPGQLELDDVRVLARELRDDRRGERRRECYAATSTYAAML